MAEGAHYEHAASEYANGAGVATHGQIEDNAREASQLQESPGIGSDTASKPQRKRNKPSLSCESCTVSVQRDSETCRDQSQEN